MIKRRAKIIYAVFCMICLMISFVSFRYIENMMDEGAYHRKEQAIEQEQVGTLMEEDEEIIHKYITLQKIYEGKISRDLVQHYMKHTNLAYTVYKDAEIIDTNTVKEQSFEDAYSRYYCTILKDGRAVASEKNIFTGTDAREELNDFIWDITGCYPAYDDVGEGYSESGEELNADYTVYVEEINLLEAYPQNDKYIKTIHMIKVLYQLRYVGLGILAAGILASTYFFIVLMKKAGHQEGVDGIQMEKLDQIPLDLYTILVAGVLWVNVWSYQFPCSTLHLFYRGILFAFSAFWILRFCMSVAIRVKMKSVWDNICLIRIAVIIKNGLRTLVSNVPYIWKGLFVIAAVYIGKFVILLAFRQFFMEYYYNNYAGWNKVFYMVFAFWIIEKILLLPLLLVGLMNMNTIKRGGEQLASGGLKSEIKTKYMLPMFAHHAKNLNQIQTGLGKAVDEKMKSERFKTELITNVSHDIKTPLTSIINYVDLMEKEEMPNETIASYMEVLKRQSMRLKKLIEDLIEASKASTGNIKVDWQKCEVDVLLTQAVGEFKEKLEAAGLDLILKEEVENVEIMADGRHLWRVFDNLFQNISKYAQPQTRVYLNLEQKEDKALIIFRNTSKYPLNISSEELMERFVRGDASRNTEGTGLGLSIAKNLTELMNGQFHLDVDGDLFKVTLEFEVIK